MGCCESKEEVDEDIKVFAPNLQDSIHVMTRKGGGSILGDPSNTSKAAGGAVGAGGYKPRKEHHSGNRKEVFHDNDNEAKA